MCGGGSHRLCHQPSHAILLSNDLLLHLDHTFSQAHLFFATNFSGELAIVSVSTFENKILFNKMRYYIHIGVTGDDKISDVTTVNIRILREDYSFFASCTQFFSPLWIRHKTHVFIFSQWKKKKKNNAHFNTASIKRQWNWVPRQKKNILFVSIYLADFNPMYLRSFSSFQPSRVGVTRMFRRWLSTMKPKDTQKWKNNFKSFVRDYAVYYRNGKYFTIFRFALVNSIMYSASMDRHKRI